MEQYNKNLNNQGAAFEAMPENVSQSVGDVPVAGNKNYNYLNEGLKILFG